jgi:Rrf2 family protein
LHLAGLAQVGDIAETNSISKKFLDHILTTLRHAGLVYSKKGKGGGYALARPADDIRVGAIVRALEGPLAPIPCGSVTAFRPCDDCGDLQTCVVRQIMMDARNAIADVLDNRSLAELRTLTDPSEAAGGARGRAPVSAAPKAIAQYIYRYYYRIALGSVSFPSASGG